MEDQHTTTDYGEPWSIQEGHLSTRLLDGKGDYFADIHEFVGEDSSVAWAKAERIIACVNACAGMADPAKEIAAMREAHEHNRKAFAELEMCEKNAMAELSISNDERDHYRRENAAMRGERDCLNRELSNICRVADAHTADEACEVIRAMREATREAHAALGGCLKYILKLPLSGSDSECETMDDAHHALTKLKPFLKP